MIKTNPESFNELGIVAQRTILALEYVKSHPRSASEIFDFLKNERKVKEVAKEIGIINFLDTKIKWKAWEKFSRTGSIPDMLIKLMAMGLIHKENGLFHWHLDKNIFNSQAERSFYADHAEHLFSDLDSESNTDIYREKPYYFHDQPFSVDELIKQSYDFEYKLKLAINRHNLDPFSVLQQCMPLLKPLSCTRFHNLLGSTDFHNQDLEKIWNQNEKQAMESLIEDVRNFGKICTNYPAAKRILDHLIWYPTLNQTYLSVRKELLSLQLEIVDLWGELTDRFHNSIALKTTRSTQFAFSSLLETKRIEGGVNVASLKEKLSNHDMLFLNLALAIKDIIIRDKYIAPELISPILEKGQGKLRTTKINDDEVIYRPFSDTIVTNLFKRIGVSGPHKSDYYSVIKNFKKNGYQFGRIPGRFSIEIDWIKELYGTIDEIFIEFQPACWSLQERFIEIIPDINKLLYEIDLLKRRAIQGWPLVGSCEICRDRIEILT